MKQYELTVLIHPDLEVDLEAPLDKVRSLVKDSGGKIAKEESWGKKRLAYRINNQSFAVYAYFEVELPADAPLKISNTLNITSEVLRYLLVKTDEKAKARAAEAAARAENRSEDKTEAVAE